MFTCRYLRKRLDFQVLFSAFTDVDAPPGVDRTVRWGRAKAAIVLLMRSFVGVIMLASDPQGLRSLFNLVCDETVEAELQIAVLQVIEEVVNPILQRPDYVQKNSQSSGNGNGGNGGNAAQHGTNSNTPQTPPNFLDAYGSILMLAFIHCGLVKSLTNLCVSTMAHGVRP